MIFETFIVVSNNMCTNDYIRNIGPPSIGLFQIILPNLSFSYMFLCKLALCSYTDCREVLSRPMQQANRWSTERRLPAAVM